jgi:hypothetical protein
MTGATSGAGTVNKKYFMETSLYAVYIIFIEIVSRARKFYL